MADTKRAVRLNTDTGFLKLIAIVTMLVDHLGAVVFPQYRVMRVIGRIAFPIFAYCVAVGCIYTRNIAKYALRMLLMAVLVQPLYVTAMNHLAKGAFDWAHNFYRVDLIVRHYYLTSHHVIHFTLFFGILLIWTLKSKKYPLTALVLAAYWYLQKYLDYGLYGIILIALFYTLIDRPLSSFIWVAAYMAWYSLPQLRDKLLPLPQSLTVYTQFWAVLALPLIYIPMNTRIRVNKWVFYLFYPAHLLVIYLIAVRM